MQLYRHQKLGQLCLSLYEFETLLCELDLGLCLERETIAADTVRQAINVGLADL